jgi:hypothetical protein
MVVQSGDVISQMWEIGLRTQRRVFPVVGISIGREGYKVENRILDFSSYFLSVDGELEKNDGWFGYICIQGIAYLLTFLF